MADDTAPYIQEEDKNSLNPSLPPQQFLGQILDKATGTGPTQESFAPPTQQERPLEEPLVDPIALAVIPAAGMLRGATKALPGIVGNEVGAIGADVAPAIKSGANAWQNIQGAPVMSIWRKLGVLPETPEEGISLLNLAQSQGWITPREWMQGIAALSPKKPYAGGGEVHEQLSKVGSILGTEKAFADGGGALAETIKGDYLNKYVPTESQQTPEESLKETVSGDYLNKYRAPTSQPQHEEAAPTSTEPVNVKSPTGEMFAVPGDQLKMALDQGYSIASKGEVDKKFEEDKYDTTGQTLGAATEGALQAATFGISTPVETALGISTPEEIKKREEYHPLAHGVGQVAGLVALTSLTSGAGGVGVLARAGNLVAKTAGMGKLGSAVISSAVENGLFQSGVELHKAFSDQSDPQAPIQSAMGQVGFASVVGGAFGTVSPLWKASGAPEKLSALMKGIQDKIGGVEGQAVSDDVANAISRLEAVGVEIAPEVKAGLSNDPKARQAFVNLTRATGDFTNASTDKAKNALKDTIGALTEHISEGLGRDGAYIESMPGQVSKSDYGRKLGMAIAQGEESRVAPLKNEFDRLDNLGKNIELTGGEPGDSLINKRPVLGDKDVISNNLSELAIKEGWTTKNNEAMNVLNGVMEDVSNAKTVQDLRDIVSSIGKNTSSPIPTPLSRAGEVIKASLNRDIYDIAAEKLGSGFKVDSGVVKGKYSEASNIVEELNSRLHIRGANPSNFPGLLRDMAKTDSETLLNRLSGTNDSHLLSYLEQINPEAAEILKNYHIDNAITPAMKAAGEGSLLDQRVLLKSLDKMPAELKNFAFSPEGLQRVKDVGIITDHLQRLPENINTSQNIIQKMFGNLASAPLSVVTALLTHSAVGAAVVGPLAKYITKDIPDAVRLAYLKNLGQTMPSVSAKALNDAAMIINASAKHDNVVKKVFKDIFDASPGAAVKVGVSTLSDSMKSKTERALVDSTANPAQYASVAGDSRYIMPQHAQALTQATASVATYLNGVKAKLMQDVQQQAPLDGKPQKNAAHNAAWNRALQIANDPKSVLTSVYDGTIIPTDVDHLKGMYPALYNKYRQQAIEGVAEANAKGVRLPYSTVMGLTLLTGQNLSSTTSQPMIAAAQPSSQQVQARQQQAAKQISSGQNQSPNGAGNNPTGDLGRKLGGDKGKALQREGKVARTQLQAAEERHSSDR